MSKPTPQQPVDCLDCGCSRGRCNEYRQHGQACCPDCRHFPPAPPAAATQGDPWTQWLHSSEFYELCQSYRHAPLAPQESVITAFNALVAAVEARHAKAIRATARENATLFAAIQTQSDLLLQERAEHAEALIALAKEGADFHRDYRQQAEAENATLRAQLAERQAITEPWQGVHHLDPWQCIFGRFHPVEEVAAAREAERAQHGAALNALREHLAAAQRVMSAVVHQMTTGEASDYHGLVPRACERDLDWCRSQLAALAAEPEPKWKTEPPLISSSCGVPTPEPQTCEWRDISTAPKDARVVDLWVAVECDKCRREPACEWVSYGEGPERVEGWCRDYDGTWVSGTALAWMPPPSPPLALSPDRPTEAQK